MTATPVLPISEIGPGSAIGLGSVPVASAQKKDFTKISGEEAKPAPMIPPEIEMTTEAENMFSSYLRAEIASARSERQPFVDRLARFKEKYRTKFPEFPKNWPIAN